MPTPQTAETPWFDAAVQPVRDGPYRRRPPAGPYACWSDGVWYADAPTPEDAAAQTVPSRHQRAAWRGHTEPAAQPCPVCRGHAVIDRGVDDQTGADLIVECPECV